MSEQVHKLSEQVREEAIARMMEKINELQQMPIPSKIKVKPEIYFALKEAYCVPPLTNIETISGIVVEIDKEMKKDWEIIYD